MKKSLVLSFFTVVSSSALLAQPDTSSASNSTSMVIETTVSTTEIDDSSVQGEDVFSAYSIFNAEIVAIDSLVRSGEISPELAIERKQMARERFEQRVGGSASNIEILMEGNNSTISIEMEEDELRTEDEPHMHIKVIRKKEVSTEDEDIVIEQEEVLHTEATPHRRNPEGHFIREKKKFSGSINFGMNNLYNENGELSNGSALVKPWGSWAVDLSLGMKRRLGESGPFTLHYGLNFSLLTLRTEDPIFKYDNGTGEPVVSFLPDPNRDIAKARFNLFYIDVPVLIGLDFGKGRLDRNFSIEIGGYGGIRARTSRELFYKDFNDDKIHEIVYGDFLTNRWRYGLMAQIGWKRVHLTAKYDLNPIFRSNYNTPNYHMATIALGVKF